MGDQPGTAGMTMSRRLQIALYVIAAYLASFGMLFVFAPSVFERVTQTPLPDAKLTLLYGQYTFAYVAFMVAREKVTPAHCHSRF
jgi:hypothetical protein